MSVIKEEKLKCVFVCLSCSEPNIKNSVNNNNNNKYRCSSIIKMVGKLSIRKHTY